MTAEDRDLLTARVRIEVRASLGPCQLCGRPRLTQADVARAASVSTVALSRFLSGGTPSDPTLRALARWAGVNPD